MEQLDLTKRIEEIRNMYKDSDIRGTFSCLVMGLFGAGKTSFIATGRKPILIDSFDPKGVIVLDDQIESGDVLVRPWWNERSDRPTEYSRWEKQWEKDIASGFLANFGTYAIDSLTTLIEALANETAKRKGRINDPKHDGNLAIQDYIPLYNNVRDIIKMSSAQGCDLVVTAHLVSESDEVTGEITAELDTFKRLKSRVPILFTEKYVITEKPIQGGVRHLLLTSSKGRFRASTQLGRNGKFLQEEEPDIKKLLEKAGFSTEDKPKLI